MKWGSILLFLSVIFSAFSNGNELELKTLYPKENIVYEKVFSPSYYSKFYILKFFSIRCQKCRMNLPFFYELNQKYNSLKMISINRKEENIINYISTFQNIINYPIAMDLSKEVLKFYKLSKFPTLLILDKDERIIFKKTGCLKEKDKKEIQEFLERQI